MKPLRDRRNAQAVFGALSVAVLVCGLLLSQTSAAVTGSIVTATSKGWTVAVWVARTTTKSGTTIPATITLDNRTGHRVEFTGCPGVVFTIVVGNAKVPNRPVIATAFCGSKMTPGVHVFHTKVLTNYQTCGINGSPKCGNPRKLPALPTGTYHTYVIWPGTMPALPRPASVTITLRP
jgi:hypothetical protein